MLIISLIALFIFIILWIVSRNYQKDFIQKIDRKEHPLKFIYSFVAFLLHLIPYKQGNMNKDTRLMSYKKGAAVILCLLSFSILIFLNELQSLSEQPAIINSTIQRPILGEGDKTVNAIYKSEFEEKEIQIHVSERILNGQEREALLRTVEDKLDLLILGENSSFHSITRKLHFPKTIKGTSIKISYDIENQDLIERDGKVNFENVDQQGSKAKVIACISYEETKREKTYEFVLYPQIVDPAVTLNDAIEKELIYKDEQSKDNSILILPDKIDDVELKWESKEGNNSVILFVVGVIVAIMMPIFLDRNKKEKEEKRINQLMRDYPEIISKFQLLLTAGMTTKGAWNRIAMDYLRVKKQINGKTEHMKLKGYKKRKKDYSRIAYEEMLITRREQELGVAEELTYEQYGKRCKVISYIRFTTILSQNIRMGSRCIAQLLEQEAREAFEERKEIAKQLGEKASTKLLGPTFGMLFVVLIIVLVPAFMSF